MQTDRLARSFLVSGLALLTAAGAALGAAGAFVTGFGDNEGGARYLPSPGTATRAHALTTDAAGRFVAAGENDRGDWILGRVDLDGSPDPSFGDGRAELPGLVVTSDGMTGGTARDLAFLPTGRILVAGRVASAQGGGSFAVRRYSSGGVLDARFGDGGTVRTDVLDDRNGGANAIATHMLGGDPSTTRIIAAGFRSPAANGAHRPAIVRLRPGGTLDPSFGRSGVVGELPGIGTAEIYDLQVLADGGIVAVGDTATPTARPMMVRLKPDGSPDETFGGGSGVVVAPRPTECLSASYRSVVIDPDGRIVVGGTARCDGRSAGSQFLFARFLSDGTRDVGFATIGSALFPAQDTTDKINAIIRQFDGSIVGVGVTGTGERPRPAVVRLRSDGTPDERFGESGVATGVGPGSTGGGADAVAIGRDGHLVTAGWATIGAEEQAALMKYDGSAAGPTSDEQTATADQTRG